MGKKYYEVVFEGKFEIIAGMLEGFLLGKNNKWEWYSSKESGIETETFTEAIKEWVSLKSRLHHIILEEEFHLALLNTLKSRDDLIHLKHEHAKSAREIKSCSFKFIANAYAKKYGDEIKAILSAPPKGAAIEGYNPEEHFDKSAKGVELYAPDHEYTFKAEGLVKGEFGSILHFRKILDDHPLVEVTNIRLEF